MSYQGLIQFIKPRLKDLIHCTIQAILWSKKIGILFKVE